MIHPVFPVAKISKQRPDQEILKSLKSGGAAAEFTGLQRRLVEMPADSQGWYLLSLAASGLDDRSGERLWIERALTVEPTSAHILTSLGIAKLQDQNIYGSYRAFSTAIQHRPNFAPARYNRALIDLKTMHFARGWLDYEWRFAYPAAPGTPRDFPSRSWDGVSPIDGKLLVWAEQSISTQIMFSSVLSEVNLPGGQIMEVAEQLVPLFQSALPNTEMVAASSPPSPRLFDGDIAAQISMGRLCGLKRRSIDDFKNGTQNYFAVDAERSIDIILNIAKPEHHTIGLAWRNNSAAQGGLSLESLEPILRVPNVIWVNLEGKQAVPEIQEFEKKTGIKMTTEHCIDTSGDLDGLAALITSCDLVLAVDNIAAHLAGALGRSVWTILRDRRKARWYWFGGDHPRPVQFARWYSSMRLIWKRDEETPDSFYKRIGGLVNGAISKANATKTQG